LYLASTRNWRPLAGYAVAALAAALILHPEAAAPRADAPLVRVLQPNIGQEATLDGSYAKKAMDALERLYID
jgi:apolipoprotein N-acyltransferase